MLSGQPTGEIVWAAMFMDLCPGTVPVIENGVSPLPAGPGMGFQLPEAGENGR